MGVVGVGSQMVSIFVMMVIVIQILFNFGVIVVI